MLIERIETYPLFHRLQNPYGDANGYKHYRSTFLIKITTRSGVEGWGEVVDWLPTLQKGFQVRIIPYLLGKWALDRTILVSTISKWHQRSAAGVSMALTEIVAKSAGLSVPELWGGSFHTKVPVYASFQSYTEGADWIENSHTCIQNALLQGFTQFKVKVGGRKLTEDQEHVTSIQTILGDRHYLAIDGNQSYDLATARSWNRLFQNWSNMLWFEEPIPLLHSNAYKELRRSLLIPLAGGENLMKGNQFISYLSVDGLDIIQPDVMHHEGIDAYRTTIQLARQYGVRISPHSYDGALNRLYALFAQSTLSAWSKMKGDEIEPLEWDVMENPFTSLIDLSPNGGYLSVPNGIGIGVELNHDIITHYLWDGSKY